ncbi:MAG: multidrug transporter AcrB [Comamonadaceae bacterium CG_4_9_14_3_um_filter_60_33]|nr:MAG: multidrug transporter AcrB [Comamonadaceae bacterium CG2_30_59_20]PIY29049.1 MAG: multidrug transporter AcrB [Comamonadaceae bacterium CG_4_10_14_3_um_filter_60_42]PJB41140.1 MAG: multidrug transporter AcrB [Comamonadaceae bacterium CG_4_9_14_3_um_filter_60_33]
MQIAETSIRRPVFATVLSLLIVLIGAVSFNSLTVREYPKIDEPVVSVSTTFAGASSEVMETQVTKVLEDSLSGIEGVDVITSASRQERSQISVRFALSRDPDAAAADVRDKVTRVRQRLPQGIDEPVIAKVEAESFPVIFLALSSDTHTALQLSEMANTLVKPVLQTAPGAAEVNIYGERKFAMRIWVDPGKLAAYQLTVQDLEDALRRANLEVPAGRIESAQREFNVTAATDLARPQEFAQVVIGTVNGQAIRIGDVARVQEAPVDERSFVRLNGRDAVGVGVVRQSTANPLDLSRGVRGLLDKLRRDLPPGVQIEVANDNSVFIEQSIKAVFTTIVEASVLVALVIFVFLRTLRASLIPLITIPVSLIGTFAMMALVGFSINTLTLLALVLAIGLVVDDAIVMLENIYRHIEEGLPPFQAAIKGAREVGFAIVAMTMTLVAVYAPLAFSPGRTGRLFTEFALALAGAVVISGIVALTLSPMLSSLLLRHNPRPTWFDSHMENLLQRVTQVYATLLRWTLHRRYLVLAVMVASGLVSWWVLGDIKRELAPLEDRGVVLARVNAPDGATLAYTDRYVRGVEKIAEDYPEFDRIFATVGNPTVSQANVFFRAKPWNERERTTLQMARTMSPRFAGLSGVNATPITPPSLGQGFRSQPLEYVIITSESYEELNTTVQTLMGELAKNPGFVQVDSNLRLNKPEIKLEVNRERAADLGVNVDAIARAIETMLGGRKVTRYKRGGEQYDVIVQTTASGRDTPDDIEAIFVRGKGTELIPLSSLVIIREVVVPRELIHFGQRRAATITANLTANYSVGEALNFMDATAQKVLKPGYATDLNGISREFKKSSDSLSLVFALALLFIFLVLAAQFESFVDPFVILFSVPLSMAGALLALKWSGGTLNVFSQIGLITLVGLITKHGILIVEFANQLREQGLDTLAAVQQSAAQRLRPIMMTTGAMVLGAVPLAVATGAGAESRQQIGWVIVGGMSLGTLLTVFVVPTMYTLLARKKVPGAKKELALDPVASSA